MSVRRFRQNYQPIADAISRLDVDQETREEVAEAITEAFAATRHQGFNADLFLAIARDPLCACAGPSADGSEPCPHRREIRVAMHLRDAPDGRSAAWVSRKPIVRCVSCGAKVFVYA
jgi:hypothetical protein